MTGLYRLTTVALCLLFSTSYAYSQHALKPTAYNNIPIQLMPAQDNAKLLSDELKERKLGRPDIFAVTLPTQIRPGSHGQWVDDGTKSTWYLRIRSGGAKTLNLGFSEYHLPEGSEFYISTATDRLGPFTAADNAEHNQLWTPVVRQDELLLELHVPTRRKKEVQLYLTSVNHDFVDITTKSSGSCNLDVICGADDGWGIVDQYRDIIRSVARYTINGNGLCTGFLVNNVNNDGTPFFMTANHCGVRPNSAQSVVAYWNFESPECRQPGSPASEETGVGSLNLNNSGAIHLASSANSDMTLTLLEEPVPEAANAYYAGWTLDPTAPEDTVLCIHHPAGDEKRISFTFNDVTRTAEDVDVEDPTGRYLVVSSWSIGTTEGGSSGSPLFNSNSQVVGQLWRGTASCDNPDGFDQYGFFSASWEGDGTTDTQVKAWLNPCGAEVTELQGFDSSDIPFALTADERCVTLCGGRAGEASFTLGSGYPAGTQLTISDDIPSLDATLSTTTASGSEEVTVNVPESDDITAVYRVTVTATGADRSNTIVFSISFVDGSSTAPGLISPTDEARNVGPRDALSWEPVADATTYDVELSFDPGFTTVIDFGSAVTETVFSPVSSYDPNQTYYWRVRANNACGGGAWTVASFTTGDGACTDSDARDTPVEIDGSAGSTATSTITIDEDVILSSLDVRLDIDHSFVRDLTATLTGPDGTTIRLFNQPNCAGTDLQVTFRDGAASSAEDFTSTCLDAIAIVGIFEPEEPLNTFRGGSVRGDWTLTVTDNDDIDGGALLGFGITYCGSPGVVGDECTEGKGDALDVPVNITGDEGETVTSTLTIDENVRINSLEVGVDIEHSFVNDLEAVLVGPDGTTIRLFTRPACGNENIQVNFQDRADNSADDFTASCEEVVAIAGNYRPEEPLSAFNGINARGDWTLRVTDNADADGGSIRCFAITYCAEPLVVDAASISFTEDVWDACLGQTARLDFSFDAELDSSSPFKLSTPAGPLSDFEISFDKSTLRAQLHLFDWAGLPAGDHVVTLSGIFNGGIAEAVSIPLRLSPPASAATLVTPEEGSRIRATDAQFKWAPSSEADSYTLEVSTDPTFATDVRRKASLTGTTARVADLPRGESLYYRVITNGSGCSSAISAVNTFSVLDGNRLGGFADGSYVAVFPNPARNEVTIDLAGEWPADTDGALFDATGRRLSNYTIDGAGQRRWDLSHLKSGIYVLRVVSGSREYTERLVVAR